MTSLLTDFEMHAKGQGYADKHLRAVNAVTHLFGDGDLDADCCKIMASAVKEFVARNKPSGESELSQAQEGQLEVIAMTNNLGEP
jgi:hypothetical protein